MTQPGEGIVGVSDENRARCNGSKLNRNQIDDNEIGSGEVDNEVEKKSQKRLSPKNCLSLKKR